MSPVQSAVLGVSADLHDSAAALVIDGQIAFASEEERFTRVKHDGRLPAHAIQWCLEAAGIGPSDLAAVAIAGKPLEVLERVAVSFARAGPRRAAGFAGALARQARSKLWIGYRVDRVLKDLGYHPAEQFFVEHHWSHAASAFYPSPFEQAAVVTLDGVGEWATTTISSGRDERIHPIGELRFPDSLGLFYTALTTFCGFEANGGEGKLMGLAPYGEPRFADELGSVLRIRDDGALHLRTDYIEVASDRSMFGRRLAELLGGPALDRGQPPGQREADIARSAQTILEEGVIAVASEGATSHGPRQPLSCRRCRSELRCQRPPVEGIDLRRHLGTTRCG